MRREALPETLLASVVIVVGIIARPNTAVPSDACCGCVVDFSGYVGQVVVVEDAKWANVAAVAVADAAKHPGRMAKAKSGNHSHTKTGKAGEDAR